MCSSPQVLCAVLGTSMQAGCQTISVRSDDSDQDGDRSGGQGLLGVAEVTWLVQPREEKAEGQSHCSLHLFQGGQPGGGSC